MKAEVQAAFHHEHGVPLSTRIFANIHTLNRLGSLVPALSNAMMNNRLGKISFNAVGIPTKRPLPRFAGRRFSRMAGKDARRPQVTLIIDTFTEYNHPQIGMAVLKIAHALGIPITTRRLPAGCCGRPAISNSRCRFAAFHPLNN